MAAVAQNRLERPIEQALGGSQVGNCLTYLVANRSDPNNPEDRSDPNNPEELKQATSATVLGKNKQGKITWLAMPISSDSASEPRFNNAGFVAGGLIRRAQNQGESIPAFLASSLETSLKEKHLIHVLRAVSNQTLFFSVNKDFDELIRKKDFPPREKKEENPKIFAAIDFTAVLEEEDFKELVSDTQQHLDSIEGEKPIAEYRIVEIAKLVEEYVEHVIKPYIAACERAGTISDLESRTKEIYDGRISVKIKSEENETSVEVMNFVIRALCRSLANFEASLDERVRRLCAEILKSDVRDRSLDRARQNARRRLKGVEEKGGG